jgi:gliding motility-associated protein GldM
MAGGKETPRQKMIGMMYLVLTALLALNVSKEIINAFVKLDQKLLENQKTLIAKKEALFQQMEGQMAIPENKKIVEPYYKHAEEVAEKCYKMAERIQTCKNDLIKAVEGKDWFKREKRGKHNIMVFESLMEIQTKDDYDAATRLFGGEEGTDGFIAGDKLRKDIMKFRDELCKNLATYKVGEKNFTFDPSKVKEPNESVDEKDFLASLDKALETTNPKSDDRDRIRQIFLTLSLPKVLKDHEETVPWQLGMFDHAPVVAGAALFTALENDVRNAEAMAIEFIASKISVPVFSFNKIEPLAFAPTAYLNVGDTMQVRVMTAAYDSTEKSVVRWSGTSMDEAAKSPEQPNTIRVQASSPGEYEMFGQIGVKVKGELQWKPWTFKYEVGQPMAIISPLDLTVLYAGYDNRIGATASGYPSEKISLNGGGCAVTPKGKGEYIVKPTTGMIGKKVALSVSVKGGKNLGSTDFKVRPLPPPLLFMGAVSNLDSRVSLSTLLGANSITAGYDASIPLTNVAFSVKSCDLVVTINGNKVAKTINNGQIGGDVKAILKQLKPGSAVMINNAKVYGPAGQQKVGAFALIIQ